jgi:hypothetical protein
MFCFSCKYIPESPVKECVDSILRFHPNEKILIADSYSDDMSYFDLFSEYKNIEIFKKNDNRQMGALWESYRRYPSEPYYILIQDTFILKKSLSEHMNSNDEFLAFMYFSEILGHNSQQYEFCENILKQTEYKIPPQSQQIFGVFGPLMIIKNSILKNFDAKGLSKSLKTRNVFEHQCAERIMGVCAEQEGYSPHIYNIEGDYLSRHGEVLSGSIETFNKHFLMTRGLRLD